MRGPNRLDELHRVAAGGDDVAEVHHDADVVAGLVEAARKLLSAFDVEAQPVEVQRFDPQLHAVGGSGAGGGDELGRDAVEVGVECVDRGVVERAAGQHQRPRPGRRGERDQHVEMPVAGGARLGVQRCVQVADVAVDRAHPQSRGGDGGGDVGDGGGVEHIGNVVAHPGQRAEVDLGEAQFGDRRQRLRQRQVPKADRGASQPGVNHPRASFGVVVTTNTLKRRLLTVNWRQKVSADC